MPAFNEQTALWRDILTAPVRQRDEALFFGDRRSADRHFRQSFEDERARQWKFRNTRP